MKELYSAISSYIDLYRTAVIEGKLALQDERQQQLLDYIEQAGFCSRI